MQFGIGRIFISKHHSMKHILLLLCILSSLSALAQSAISNQPKRNSEWDSNTHYVEAVDGGYLSLVSQDPLTVAEDPIIGFSQHADVFVNHENPTLTLKFTENPPQQRITVAISDTAGKLLQSESFFPKEKEYIISIRKLKAQATYRMAVYCSDKRVLYWGTFKRN